jgi:hypothetical protein
LASQSKFQRDSENNSICTINFIIKWIEEVEPPIHSLSFVILEKNKNLWHNVDGSDQTIVFCPEPVGIASQGKFSGLPVGKIG